MEERDAVTEIGYHASHEQFAPSQLLELVQQAEAAGFDSAKSSDHFHPWSTSQGQSGFAWAWLGAAMQATRLSYGMISAPGYRYHPAILAQAAATIGDMFPGRLWLALGSGEAINEAITGEAWPDKAERNARLGECVDIIRALFAGETVTHRGRVTVVKARLWTRASKPVPLLGAAVTSATAAWAGCWADGLLTTGGALDTVREVIHAFRSNGGEGKPIHVQHALSWAETEDQALGNALHQWGPVSAGGDLNWNLARVEDFDRVGTLASEDTIRKCVAVSSDLGRHAQWLSDLAALGVTSLQLHNVGRNQQQFVENFGAKVLPRIRS
jgi:coenzyme F420-dependent glucose-6-phosphate dehydrogenase